MKAKTTVEVKEFSIRRVIVPITGESPLIVHAWSEKAIKMMEDKQQGKAKNRKHDVREPQAEFEAAKHISPQGWEGFPAVGFKKSMIRAAKIIGMVMKDVQTSFKIKSDCEETQLVRIKGKARMRKDMVRIGMGSSDIRYRPEYSEWSASLVIEFNEGVLSLDEVFQLVKAAGYGCGVGEMRPEKTAFGFGCFKLADEKQSENGKLKDAQKLAEERPVNGKVKDNKKPSPVKK